MVSGVLGNKEFIFFISVLRFDLVLTFKSKMAANLKVTSAGWQVILCDPIWHVSSRSGETGVLRT